ncbi:TetR/AcrR family transcriptional regulator [Sodalis sp. RH16]|jgi:AcrR family transcriptional regulator|uniref:TetR/AcrR family transcriptional regulator n=1 Tax=Sodalis sp. RH16 TaxID=3394331 RepID=UPI0039B41D1D
MKVRTQARREAIVEAAARLFQEMGYERASMNELSKRLGGSKATLYSYFSSKEELFTAVIHAYATQHLTEAAEELTAYDDKTETLEDKLMRFGKRMLKVLVNDNSALSVYRMVVGEAGHSDIGTLFYESGPRASIEKLSALLAGAMDREELRVGDPYIRALQFLALLTAETEVRIYQRQSQPVSLARIHEMTRCAVNLFLYGAAPPARPAPANLK